MSLDQVEIHALHEEAMAFLGGADSMQSTLREEIRKALTRYGDGISAGFRERVEKAIDSSNPVSQDFLESIAFQLRLGVNSVFRVPTDTEKRQSLVSKMEAVGFALEAECGGALGDNDPDNVLDILIIFSALEGMDRYYLCNA